MNTLLHTGEIRLFDKGDVNDPVYLLGGNAKIYNTEYRIMENTPGLLSFCKTEMNGQTKLSYLTDGLEPLSVMLSQIEEDAFLSIAVNICETIRIILDNGFLNWQHLDLDKDRIFIHPLDKSVFLVYLPIEGVYLPAGSVDKEIRSFIASLSSETKEPNSRKLIALRYNAHLREGSLKEFTLYLNALLNSSMPVSQRVLALYNEDEKHVIIIDKPRFLIGKKSESVDGLIPYSKFVGRVHCQIVRNNDGYLIYDLGSKNGTFVNGVPVKRDKGVPIKGGDILKIANVQFVAGYKEI